jgi:hypothetical protein
LQTIPLFFWVNLFLKNNLFLIFVGVRFRWNDI